MTFYQLCSCIILNDRMTVHDELGIWNEVACSAARERLRKGAINLSQG